jgi:hypothetical protein
VLELLGDGTDYQIWWGRKLDGEMHEILEAPRRLAEVQDGSIGNSAVGKYVK